MPPKNKGTGKKPAKARTPTLIDGLTKEEMSKEQLEEHIVRLREELDREREERNYFQKERDNIHTFWEITDRQLEEVKAELQNLEKDIEDDEGRHQVEIKVYKQKMKHLLCEHQNTISELKAGALVSTEVLQNDQEQLEAELHKEMRAIMVDMQKLDNENLFKELELKHDEEMTKTRNNLKKRITEIESNYEEKVRLRQQDLDNMRKKETSEREDQWNCQFASLKEDHNKALSDIYALFNLMQRDIDITQSLKTQIGKMEANRKRMEEDRLHLLQDAKCLTECLLKVKEEIAGKEKKMKYYGMKKDTNGKVKKKELYDLRSEHKDLEQKFIKLQLERDELYKTYSQSTENVQDKAAPQIMQLEKKLKALTDSLEKTQAQLRTVLSASNMDQIALSGLTKKIEEKLDSCNNTIRNLQNQNAQISKALKDLLLIFEAKQRAFGVPVE
ncbi:dynein regulatory complex subunit 4-like isoform X1 [Trachinotus anak]|uniref:dynein regulatory complex subunit 4-like isoform X1 n=1 Tax=Trachinotus anak TaxID=443729 RepID=UPI0039F1E447